MNVIKDITRPQKLTVGKDEERRVRVWRYEGVEGPDYLATAKNYFETPRKGAGYPAGWGWTGALIEAEFEHPGNRRDVVIGRFTYSNKAEATSGGSGSQQQNKEVKLIDVSCTTVLLPVRTNRDFEGKPMFIAYSPQWSASAPAAGQSDTESQLGPSDPAKEPDARLQLCEFADYDRALRVRIVLEELWNPTTEAEKWVGVTNRKEYWGKPVGTVLVENISGTISINPDEKPADRKPRRWRNTYDFLINLKGFLQLGVWREGRLGGATPSNVDVPQKIEGNLVDRDKDDSGRSDPKLKAGVPYGNGWGVFRVKRPRDLAVLLDPKIIDPTKL